MKKSETSILTRLITGLLLASIVSTDQVTKLSVDLPEKVKPLNIFDIDDVVNSVVAGKRLKMTASTFNKDSLTYNLGSVDRQLTLKVKKARDGFDLDLDDQANVSPVKLSVPNKSYYTNEIKRFLSANITKNKAVSRRLTAETAMTQIKSAGIVGVDIVPSGNRATVNTTDGTNQVAYMFVTEIKGAEEGSAPYFDIAMSNVKEFNPSTLKDIKDHRYMMTNYKLIKPNFADEADKLQLTNFIKNSMKQFAELDAGVDVKQPLPGQNLKCKTTTLETVFLCCINACKDDNSNVLAYLLQTASAEKRFLLISANLTKSKVFELVGKIDQIESKKVVDELVSKERKSVKDAIINGMNQFKCKDAINNLEEDHGMSDGSNSDCGLKVIYTLMQYGTFDHVAVQMEYGNVLVGYLVKLTDNFDTELTNDFSNLLTLNSNIKNQSNADNQSKIYTVDEVYKGAVTTFKAEYAKVVTAGATCNDAEFMCTDKNSGIEVFRIAGAKDTNIRVSMSNPVAGNGKKDHATLNVSAMPGFDLVASINSMIVSFYSGKKIENANDTANKNG